MTSQTLLPSAILQPYIKDYLIIESASPIQNRVLPNTQMTMAFSLRGSNAYCNQGRLHALPGCSISGLRNTPRLIHYQQTAATLIVRFQPGGVAAFFPIPMHNFFNSTIDLSLLPQATGANELHDKLQHATENWQRVRLLEEFFFQRLAIGKPDHLITQATKYIENKRGFLRISELGETLCMSPDSFQKRFRKQVGATPKQYATIVRMQHLVQAKPNGRFFDWAIDHGYYDPPHFNREFKKFTGLTPTELYSGGMFW